MLSHTTRKNSVSLRSCSALSATYFSRALGRRRRLLSTRSACCSSERTCAGSRPRRPRASRSCSVKAVPLLSSGSRSSATPREVWRAAKRVPKSGMFMGTSFSRHRPIHRPRTMVLTPIKRGEAFVTARRFVARRPRADRTTPADENVTGSDHEHGTKAGCHVSRCMGGSKGLSKADPRILSYLSEGLGRERCNVDKARVLDHDVACDPAEQGRAAPGQDRKAIDESPQNCAAGDDQRESYRQAEDDQPPGSLRGGGNGDHVIQAHHD